MNINTNYKNNYQNSICQKPAFKGAVGERLIKEIIKAEDTIELSTMMNEVKGFMGPNKAKVLDIVESFVGKIKELQKIVPEKNKNLSRVRNEYNNMPEDWKVITKKSDEVYSRYIEQTGRMNLRSRETEEKLKLAKNEAKRYEQMKEVKSIEELDIIMPETLKEVIDETNAGKNNSADSMFNFLMNNGDGKEALAQVERFKKLSKSYQNGMYTIPEISEYAKGKYAPASNVVNSTMGLIKMSLKGNLQGSYLESSSTRARVKDRAMTFLKPLYEDSNCFSQQGIEKELDKTFTETVEFHRNFSKGKNYLLKNKKDCEVIDHNLGYDTSESHFEYISKDGFRTSCTYDDVAYVGSRNDLC